MLHYTMKKIFLDTNALYYYCDLERSRHIDIYKLELFLDSNIGYLHMNAVCLLEAITRFREDEEKVETIISFLKTKYIQITDMISTEAHRYHKYKLARDVKQRNGELPDMVKRMLPLKIDMESEILNGFVTGCALAFLTSITSDKDTGIKITKSLASRGRILQGIISNNLQKAYAENCVNHITKSTFSMLLRDIIHSFIKHYIKISSSISEDEVNFLNSVIIQITNPKKEVTSTIAKILFTNKKYFSNKDSFVQHLNTNVDMLGNAAQRIHWIKTMTRIINTRQGAKFNKNDIFDWAFLKDWDNKSLMLTFDDNILDTLKQCDNKSYAFCKRFMRLP